MRSFGRITVALAVVLTATIHCQPAVREQPFPAAGTVRIVRDTYGVPHIYAANKEDLMYGFGYAVAEDRARQIFTSLYTVYGRLAELQGEEALEQDILIRSFRFRTLAEEKINEIEPELRLQIVAYCDGVNAYVESQRDNLPGWISHLESIDIVAMIMKINFDFAYSTAGSDMRRSGIGSNEFAVAPQRSASGHALLSIDPHLPFAGTYRWTEAHLQTPGFSVVGAVIPGLPIIALGHNGKAAWMLTVNFPDLADIYAEEINPENPGQYRAADGWREFDTWTEKFRISTANGTEEREITLRSTRHGPVLKVDDGVAYAVRLAGIGEIGILRQMLGIMNSATVFELNDQFKQPGFVMWNVLSADTEGNISYLYNALCPRRDPSLDWSRAVPGADPRAEWQGYIPFEELPLLVNPESGWLQNCNDSPWYVTSDPGINPEDLPFRLCTVDHFGDRGRRITELLKGDDSVTLDEMIAYATETTVLRARWWVPRMIDAFESYKERMGLSGSETERAIDLLRGWDYRADVDSSAMTLFAAWWGRNELGSIISDDRLTEEIKQKQLLDLGSAAAELESSYGKLEVPWGEVLRLQHGDLEVPLAGGPFDIPRAAWGQRRGGKIMVTGGSSYQMVVELSDPPRAFSSMPFGVSEDPDSKHFADITKLYSELKYKPVWFTWEELKDNVRETRELKVPQR